MCVCGGGTIGGPSQLVGVVRFGEHLLYPHLFFFFLFLFSFFFFPFSFSLRCCTAERLERRVRDMRAAMDKQRAFESAYDDDKDDARYYRSRCVCACVCVWKRAQE